MVIGMKKCTLSQFMYKGGSYLNKIGLNFKTDIASLNCSLISAVSLHNSLLSSDNYNYSH